VSATAFLTHVRLTEVRKLVVIGAGNQRSVSR